MNKTIIRYITNPLWEWAAGRKTLKYLKELERSQHWPRKKLEELQNQRLRSLIKHAYENVPYYRKVFRERKLTPNSIKTVHDLKKLPVLTKEIVAENFESLKARNMSIFGPKLYRTGGSTGRPLVFYNAKKTFEYHLAAAHRSWRWIGFDFGSRYADLWGATLDLKNENNLKKRIHMGLTRNRLLIPSFKFAQDELENYSAQIVRFRPEFIHGYASSIEIMADYMKKNGMALEGVKGIITSGEKLFPHQRKKIESFFNAPVYDDYGSRESSIRATQCENLGGYHISVENGVLELLRDGENVSEGTSGKVTITEFHNYAMPLIRYENGDVAEALDDNCSCGRTLPMLKRIDGRISDIFVTKDGKIIPGEMFIYVFLEFTGKAYQVIQKTPEKMILKIVPGDNYDYSNMERIVSELKKWLGDIEVKVRYVDSIPRSSSGKTRFLISEVKPRF